jgi:hypothetical protein
MRKDSISEQEALAAVRIANPKYLIIGFKSDGIRSIPQSYEFVAEYARTEDDVCQKISKLKPPFKVFEVGIESQPHQYWTAMASRRAAEKTESEERHLLQKLKDKYEK